MDRHSRHLETLVPQVIEVQDDRVLLAAVDTRVRSQVIAEQCPREEDGSALVLARSRDARGAVLAVVGTLAVAAPVLSAALTAN